MLALALGIFTVNFVCLPMIFLSCQLWQSLTCQLFPLFYFGPLKIIVHHLLLTFQISGLNSGRGLLISIYAENANGKSTAAVIEGFTLKVAQLQVGEYGTNLMLLPQFLQSYCTILCLAIRE